MNNTHILFVHIPKTAGTSFRMAAYEYFGEEQTFFDYSSASSETSELIRERIYQKEDFYAFGQSLFERKSSFLSGHFNVLKYAPLYHSTQIVSFLRDPVEQVISHFNHFKNHHGYEKELLDFVKEQRFCNVQFKTLRHIPLSLFGFIGFTDAYNRSIDIFNEMYGTSLKHKHMNIKSKGSLNKEDIDPSTIEEIVKRNQLDIIFYKEAKKQFELRERLHAKNLPFTYGHIQKSEDNTIYGIAFEQNAEQAVEIEIYCADRLVETVHANRPKPGMLHKSIPRKGFVGFEYKHHKEEPLKEKLRAIVKKTGQEIV